MTRRPSSLVRVGSEPEMAAFSAAVVTDIGAANSSAVVARLTGVIPGSLLTSLAGEPPAVFLLVPNDLPTRIVFAAGARSLGVVAVLLDRAIGPDEVHAARRELADAAIVARRVCAPGSIITVDELLPYRCLLSAQTAELEVLTEKTLGGVLRQPQADRRRLLETLWARHAHDTETAAVRTLGIDPRTMRRRRERIRRLTGLDPSRQADRFRLDMGLHALRVLETAQYLSGRTGLTQRPYPRESHEPGMRPSSGIAEARSESSSSAPYPPQTTADRAGGREQKC